MRDEKKLDGKDWMHVLGTLQMDWACYLHRYKGKLGKHTLIRNFPISFDSALI